MGASVEASSRLKQEAAAAEQAVSDRTKEVSLMRNVIDCGTRLQQGEGLKTLVQQMQVRVEESEALRTRERQAGGLI